MELFKIGKKEWGRIVAVSCNLRDGEYVISCEYGTKQPVEKRKQKVNEDGTLALDNQGNPLWETFTVDEFVSSGAENVQLTGMELPIKTLQDLAVKYRLKGEVA